LKSQTGSIKNLNYTGKEEVFEIKIRKIKQRDRPWIEKIFKTNWGSDFVITKGEVAHCQELDGFIAEMSGKKEGLITYRVRGGELEIMSLNSLVKEKGTGTALINRTIGFAKKTKIKRIWLITTNDNINAIKFYQRRGFKIVRVYPGAVNLSRRLKPSIPEIGDHGIPISDEIEFEIRLEK
jgi:N-acetylglutamate synthase-like GNAT family acetyltransferase